MVTRDEVMDALRDAASRFVALVESLEPDDANTPVPGLDWDVGETIAHVLTVTRRGFADRRRSARAEETADLNQVCLDETPQRDPRELAALLRADLHTAIEVVYPKIPDDLVFPFHGGQLATMTPALRVVLGELLIHGFDVARATDRPWRIEAHEARMLVPSELLNAWLREDTPDESYEIRLGDSAPLRFEFVDRQIRVTEGHGDTIVALEPGQFVLQFYAREPVTDDGLARLQSRFVPG